MTKTKAMRPTWPDKILAAVAAGKGTLAELDKLPNANPDSIRWYCSKLTAAGKLRRVSPGTYALPAKKTRKKSKR